MAERGGKFRQNEGRSGEFESLLQKSIARNQQRENEK